MLLALVVLLTLTACTNLPPPVSPPVHPAPPVELPHETAGTPVQVASALIAAEREAARAGDLEFLTELWAPDARIVDGRATDDPADDYVWQGRDAIIDRYVIAVLPAPPPPPDSALFESLNVITSTDDNVQVELGVDRWTLVLKDGRWQLSELRYN